MSHLHALEVRVSPVLLILQVQATPATAHRQRHVIFVDGPGEVGHAPGVAHVVARPSPGVPAVRVAVYKRHGIGQAVVVVNDGCEVGPRLLAPPRRHQAVARAAGCVGINHYSEVAAGW